MLRIVLLKWLYICICVTEKNRKEKLEDTKEVLRFRKSEKDRQHNDQKKKWKWQTTIYKTIHRKLKIEQHEP